ncbi:sigma-70 family RNA polymerase sigma factor [Fulvivirgaceae bacterium PWU5]|uniref:Sigma-70 family RNA polymerase sigma factor n=1 Tax=Dawidia cretensis TaxID=2782350 RepID=A0AAP2GPA8_9BACT|nr:sigma-70 family RNA polymerase sigma factor [Dawidia cretensis]MBT1708431.1 sigma-70 family RNA polymerase sigma factor [Dawidia cretensis]
MSKGDTQLDDNIWRSFKGGDKTAFAALYRIYAGALLNYGSKISWDRTLVEDSIQDLFFELWNTRERITEPNSIKLYLFKALRYKIYRNTKSNDFTNTLDLELFENLASPSHESKLIRFEVQSEQMENLRTLIKQLPKRQQEAINLRYYHDFSNEEIAKIMGVNYQSAANFIFLAIRKLKLNLKVSVTSFFFFLNFF